MRFERVHRAVIYGLVVIGLLPLALSGEVPLPIVVAAYGAVIASSFSNVPRERQARRARRWNLITVASLLAVVLLGLASGNWLLYAILFAIVMVITRLFTSRSSRDVFQLYGLTFITMIAGAVVNPSITFLFSFVAYVVLLVWALVLLHLQKQLEELAEDEAEGMIDPEGERPDQLWQARSLVTGRFLVGTSMLALMVFAASLVIFFLFPRLGMGFFFGQGRQGQSVSGFADQIELGHFGTIKDNYQVVMRVELPDDPGGAKRLRMRGISFDNYDGRTWSKTTHKTTEMPRVADGTWRVMRSVDAGRDVRRDSLRQVVYLEPLQLETRTIFGEPQVDTVSIDNPRIDRLKRDRTVFHQDLAADLSSPGRTDTALRYEVRSEALKPTADQLRAASTDAPRFVRSLYLQLPDKLDPRIAELAREITEDRESDYDKVRAIERHLLRYTYSTEGGHDRANPLSDFLFNKKSGHCEYFSTAMVILARTLGIPARPANGFYGGAYNSFGEYYAVRQADAHSWVEIWFDGFGWMTFDPTPPAMVIVPPEEGFLGSIKEWFDSLKLSWYKWVVEYDLEKQLEFFREVGRFFSGLFPSPEGGESSNPKAWKKGLEKWISKPSTWALIASPFILGIIWRYGLIGLFFAWLRRRLSRAPEPPGGVVGRLYRQTLKALEKQGIGRAVGETPTELAKRLTETGYAAHAEVARLTRAFETARYAERMPDADGLEALEADLLAVKKVRVR